MFWPRFDVLSLRDMASFVVLSVGLLPDQLCSGPDLTCCRCATGPVFIRQNLFKQIHTGRPGKIRASQCETGCCHPSGFSTPAPANPAGFFYFRFAVLFLLRPVSGSLPSLPFSPMSSSRLNIRLTAFTEAASRKFLRLRDSSASLSRPLPDLAFIRIIRSCSVQWPPFLFALLPRNMD